MKKSLLLLIIFMILNLCACGSNKYDKNKSTEKAVETTSEKTTEAKEKSSEKTITLEEWAKDSDWAKTTLAALQQDVIEVKIEENTLVYSIVYEYMPNNMDEFKKAFDGTKEDLNKNKATLIENCNAFARASGIEDVSLVYQYVLPNGEETEFFSCSSNVDLKKEKEEEEARRKMEEEERKKREEEIRRKKEAKPSRKEIEEVVVNRCCRYSEVKSINISYGTFDTVWDERETEWVTTVKGTYLPVNEFGMYDDRMKFEIVLHGTSIDENSFSSAY